MVIIGSARIDEYGNTCGGSIGDQKQTTTPDYKGEVSMQNFYIHKKGWNVLRAKDKNIAIALAKGMVIACNNKHIGYNQSHRLYIINDGIDSNKDTECDCSSLVRACLLYAGVEIDNFTTHNEVTKIGATCKFDLYSYTTDFKLQIGDILVTKNKGHTAIVVDCDNPVIGNSFDIDDLAKRVIKGEFGYGATRRQKLEKLQIGLYSKVQKRVNEMQKK